MKKNKKGFGLVMAIMIVTVLVIMAAGFFVVTDYSTKSTIRNAERLDLYWAAESASNFNVNWWVNQPKDVRVFWNKGYTWNTKTQYPDVNSYTAGEDKFPNSKGTSKLGKFYLHASTIKEFGKNPKVGKYEIITARYKSERKPRPGEVFEVGKEEAVWILDSYAYDPATGQIANITLTNVFNSDMDLGILNNSEAIVNSLFSGGFNGKLSSFSRKDIRYGQCYYGSLIRLDPTSGGEYNRFFAGPVLSGAFKTIGDNGVAGARSRYGNSSSSPTLVTTDLSYRYGLAVATKLTQATFLTTIGNVMGGGSSPTPYEGQADLEDTDDITWTWPDIVSDGINNGLFLLPSGSGSVSVLIKIEDGLSYGYVTYSGKTVKKALGPDFTGVGVPAGYGDVSIEGISSKDFTLVTEKSQVNIVGDFYISQMKEARNKIQTGVVTTSSDWAKAELQKLYDAMNALDPKTPKLGIISSLALTGTQILGDPPITFDSNKNIFTTSALITNNGSLEATNHVGSGKYINVGSMITLGNQDKEQGGTSSHTYTKALIQDLRFLKEDCTYPSFFGPGPSTSQTFAGLNPQNVWARQVTQTTDDWNNVVWKPINGATPSF